MGFDIAIGARVRKSPYYEKTVEAGVSSFSVYNHMLMPTGYGDWAAEYDRLVNGVAMWDVAVERQVSIKGPDAEALTRYLTSRELGALKPEQGKYVPICNHEGILINDPVLLPVADDEFWLSIADSDIKLWAQAVAAERGLNVTVSEPDVSPLAIQGPKAMDVGAQLFGDWVHDLRFFGFKAANIDGIDLLVARSGWSKQGGLELYLLDGDQGGQLWDLVKEAGASFDIGPGCPNSIERIESGLVSYGADTDEETNPFEVGLGKFVNLDREDDFVGKAALTEILANGIKRAFVGFLLEDDFPSAAQHKMPVISNGVDVGFLSSSAYSPRVGSSIGIGLVATEVSADGSPVSIRNGDKNFDATVTSLPFKIK